MFNSKVPYAGYFSKEEYPIIEAIHNKDKETLLKMMGQGWNVNSTGKFGMSYLLYAIWEDNYTMTEFLLENGADPNFVSNLWEVSPDDVVPCLPLSTACFHNIKFIKLLIKHGADVNDDRAPLPVFSAALNNDKKKIEYLLEHGADINKMQNGFETVITDQATAGKWSMVLWLWDKGADPMKTGKNENNVAVWVQDAIDMRNNENKEIKQVIVRLKSIGVKFPYRPAQKDSMEVDN
ncbi:MAG: ankyrin repeat domain-containing protein [Prevotella sp.]|nr:ankyrin repeat domain-containing protein [Prevotella sp.]